MMLPNVTTEKIDVKVGEITFNPEFYARFEPDQKLIADYEENIDSILKNKECAHISGNNILIDGYHRWKAAERALGKDAIVSVIKHNTTDTNYIMLESYAANTRNGKRNKREENIRNIRALYVRGFTLEQIQEKLGLGKALIYSATSDDRKREKEEKNKRIVDLYLRAENTQEKIAELMGVPQNTISVIVENIKNSTCGIFDKEFTPLLYNIWNLPKQDNAVKHFGAFPEIFMENLLYYHTEPLDIVYDPFAGGGTTVDVCKRMFRRYYCSDREVIPGREETIKKHDVKDGLPEDLPKPDLVFLDPPYWKQAESKYSDSKEDLGNMGLSDFNSAMKNLFKRIADRKINRIALVISPNQWRVENHEFVDHIFDFHQMLSDKYKIKMRYQLPYSSEQYNGTQIDIAKKERISVTLIRDLVVWERM